MICVYLVGNTKLNYYKIGMSGSLRGRLETISKGHEWFTDIAVEQFRMDCAKARIDL